MRSVDALCRALESEAVRLQGLGYFAVAHELRGKVLDVESARRALENAKKVRAKK